MDNQRINFEYVLSKVGADMRGREINEQQLIKI